MPEFQAVTITNSTLSLTWVHPDTATNFGRAKLPLCHFLCEWARWRGERSPTAFAEISAARQRRPTAVAVSRCARQADSANARLAGSPPALYRACSMLSLPYLNVRVFLPLIVLFRTVNSLANSVRWLGGVGS